MSEPNRGHAFYLQAQAAMARGGKWIATFGDSRIAMLSATPFAGVPVVSFAAPGSTLSQYVARNSAWLGNVFGSEKHGLFGAVIDIGINDVPLLAEAQESAWGLRGCFELLFTGRNGLLRDLQANRILVCQPAPVVEAEVAPQVAELAEVIASVCEPLGIEVCALAPLLAIPGSDPPVGDPVNFQPDGVHYSITGCQAVYQAYDAAVARWLRLS